MKVYLAGPIAGLNYEGATNWRGFARHELSRHGIDGFSPMRAKEFLVNVPSFSTMPLENQDPYKEINCLASLDGIIGRDSYDVRSADLILANFLGAKQISMGTIWELGLAFGLNKPVVVAMEETGNPNDHGLAIGSCRWRVTSLEQAIQVTCSILLP